MTVRKIDLMHKCFGTDNKHKCGECSNLIAKFYQRIYYKCSVYGDSSGEGTDWAKSWVACGMFGKQYNGKNIVKYVRTDLKDDVIAVMEGQLSLE